MALIFPALPGLAWSVTKSPTFQTRIQRAVSGRELRALDYPYPLWQFTLVFDFLRDNPAAGFDELRTLMGFFMLCQGAFGTFLFRIRVMIGFLGSKSVLAIPLGQSFNCSGRWARRCRVAAFLSPSWRQMSSVQSTLTASSRTR